jgi:alkylation response protein AidB-like acyl-CoA dehydrogenase
VDGLLSIGEVGIAEGVGAAMHLYMLAAFATMPIQEARIAERRRAFVAMILASRLLLANTGSDAQTRSANAGRSATVAVRVDGGSVVNGTKSFLSLADVADVVIFTAMLDDGSTGFFVAPMNDPAIRIGARHFDAAFPLHTNSVEFHDLFVPDPMSFAESPSQAPAGGFHLFQRALFQSLISAVYLGAARRALKEAAKFAKAHGLSDVDGVHVELGRLLIRWQGALAPTRICARPLRRFVQSPCAANLQSFAEAATVAKQVGCAAAADIVSTVQRFIGTRSMESGHVMAEIVRLAPFGALHPIVGAQADRQFGRALLDA